MFRSALTFRARQAGVRSGFAFFESKLQTLQCFELSTAAASSFKIPPNLKFDPRSSFAPKPSRPVPAPQKDSSSEQDEEVAEEFNEDADEEEEEEEEDEEGGTEIVLPETAYAIPLPERLHVEVHTLFAPLNSRLVGSIWLDEAVFGRDPIRVDLLKRTVDYYRNKKRGRRKAKTKTIAEVSGSGRKLRPQKGSGNARVGHSRPPHFRKGAKAHGPKNTTDYGNTKLNKKVRKQALAHALSQKLKEGNLILLNQLFELPTHKTKELVRLLSPWGIGGRDGISALILDSYHAEESAEGSSPQAVSVKGVPANLWAAAANIPRIKVGNHNAASVYDILKHEKLVLTLSAVQQLEGRLKNF